jgi:hypothetical protein
MRRLVRLSVAAVLLSGAAHGYYFFIHYAGRSVPYNPIPEKFDISVLPSKTIQYFISDVGPAQLASGDSFAAVIRQIRLAAKTWNDVESSDLRLAFGGMATPGTPANAPGIDVVFDDEIPPGIAALGGPTTCATPGCTATAAAFGTPFVAIQRSTLRIRRDLRDSPSYTEAAFMTLVHEFGHTLGLQHTLTSGTMSTQVTRTTTKARPLAADDVAGISILYPRNGFLANSATISGRVTLGGAGVNLASVVAIAANGAAVSALTNPDGTYTIQGIPAGQSYYVYVHPLPPAGVSESKPANIEPPKDPDGAQLPAGPAFDTVFYPGVRDPGLASPFFLGTGESKTGVDFAVNRRNAPGISSVFVYGYPGTFGVSPAPLLGSEGRGAAAVAAGSGLLNGTSLAPGFSVGVLGQAGASVLSTPAPRYYEGYVLFYLAPTFGSNSGPRHLVFTGNNDIYVLPAAVLITTTPPPSISGVRPGTENGARIATISGGNFDGTTRILFDGAVAAVLRRNPDGSLVVAPPAASAGHRAAVVALNGDGQSSLFLDKAAPTYLYDLSDAAFVSVSPSALPAGSEAMVEITGVNAAFVDGQVAIGFGTSDVTVKRLWVVGPNRVLANVAVNPGPPAGSVQFSVASGLQLIAQPFAFQVLAPNPRQSVIAAPVVNAATGAAGVPSGGLAMMSVSNLTAPGGSIAVTVNDQRAAVLSVSGGQVTFQVPAGTPVGPAIVRLQLPGGEPVLPVVMQVDVAAPIITAAFSAPGVPADAARPAFRGSLTGFLVSGLPDAATLGDFSSVRVNVGGVDHAPISAANQNGAVLVQFVLSTSVPAGAQPATVSFNGAASQPFTLQVR